VIIKVTRFMFFSFSYRSTTRFTWRKSVPINIDSQLSSNHWANLQRFRACRGDDSPIEQCSQSETLHAMNVWLNSFAVTHEVCLSYFLFWIKRLLRIEQKLTVVFDYILDYTRMKYLLECYGLDLIIQKRKTPEKTISKLLCGPPLQNAAMPYLYS
jgi:hypothetical protein